MTNSCLTRRRKVVAAEEGQRAVAPSLVGGGAVARSSAASRWDPREASHPANRTRRPRRLSRPGALPTATDRATRGRGALGASTHRRRVRSTAGKGGDCPGGSAVRNESSLETGRGREHSITDAMRWWSRGRGALAAGRDEAWSGIPSGHSTATTCSGFLRCKRPVGCWDEQAQCVYRSATAAQNLRREGVEPSCPGLVENHLPPERSHAL